MNEAITIRGTILPDGTLRLTAPLSLPAGEVEVTVRPVAGEQPKESILDFLERIAEEQKARGHVSPTAEEIDAEVRRMREEWEQRVR